jgi:hypothetical protein
LRAEIALRANDPAAALSCCDQSVRDNPYDSEVRLLRAGIRFHEGDPAGSREDYDFLERHFGNPALRARAAISGSISDVAMHNFVQARARLSKLVADNVGNQGQLRARLACINGLAGGSQADAENDAAAEGYAAMGRGEWEAARRKLAEALFGVKPTDPVAGEMLWLLSGALRACGQPVQAEEMENRIRAVWPRSPYLTNPWPVHKDKAADRVAT